MANEANTTGAEGADREKEEHDVSGGSPRNRFAGGIPRPQLALDVRVTDLGQKLRALCSSSVRGIAVASVSATSRRSDPDLRESLEVEIPVEPPAWGTSVPEQDGQQRRQQEEADPKAGSMNIWWTVVSPKSL